MGPAFALHGGLGSPSGVTNPSENSGSATKPPTSSENRWALTRHSGSEARHPSARRFAAVEDSAAQKIVGCPSVSWKSDHSMRNSDMLNCKRSSSHVT